jgi:ABC-2 type transport system ATP-binding protein
VAVFQTHDLTKRFGTLTAVDRLNLTVQEGDRYGFLGINGAGKTTTIRMALNLLRPTGGSVSIFGRDVRADFVGIMKSVGALVERPAYYPAMSGFRNVELMGRLSGGVTRAQAMEILEQVGLAERAGSRAHTYSHGMVQRLGIAIALVARPRLVILDEPTNGLDPEGIVQIRTLLLERNRRDGTSLIVSSHLLHEVELTCNRVGIIRRGKLLVEDETQALLKKAARGVRLRADPLPQARRTLEQLDYVRGATLEPAEQVLIVNMDPELAGQLNAALVAAGVSVAELTPLRPSLESLFFALQEAA